MTHAITRGLGAALLIVSTAGTAAAQTGAGSIAGTVKDASGGAVPGATVTVASPDKGVEQAGQSNAQGAFVFPLLPPGTYTVSVELSGFKKTAKSNVILPVASRVNVGDLVLEVGNVAEAVTVEANVGRLQIQTESGERSDLVTNAQLRDIALNGRNVVDLMKTIPGVIAGGTVTSSTVNNVVGGFNINGTRSLQHDYTVDGVTNLNLGNNTGALVSVNPDALEDVKVMTSNYQAEYGRSGGGVVALTTRGGTNEYHGGLRYFKRDDRLNANTFFNNARGGDDAGFPRPPYRFNYYGWDFGGPVPIEKSGAHKVFFFAAQEYYDQLVPQTTSNNIRVPTAAERGRRLLTDRGRYRPRDPDHRSAHRSAVPRQSHPGRPVVRAGPGGAEHVSAAELERLGDLQLHVAGTQPVPATRGHRARGLADRVEHTAERPLGPQLRRSAVRVRHHHGVVELPADRHRPQERAGQHAVVHADAHLQPDARERVHLRRRPRRRRHRARVTTRRRDR